MIQTRDRKRRAPFSNPRTAPKPSCIRSSRKSIFRVTVATTSVRQRFVVALHVCSSRRRHGRRGAHVGTAVFQTRPTTVTIPFCARQLPNYGPPRTQLSRPRVGRPSRTPQFRKFSVRFSLLFCLFRRTSPPPTHYTLDAAQRSISPGVFRTRRDNAPDVFDPCVYTSERVSSATRRFREIYARERISFRVFSPLSYLNRSLTVFRSYPVYAHALVIFII